jgi:hypothetical protein
MATKTTTTKRGTTRKTDTVATPKPTRKATPSDTPIKRADLIDEATLLRSAKALPGHDRIAIVAAGRLIGMTATKTPGQVIRALAKELRVTPALRDDAIALGLILRGVADGFDRAGKGAE